MAVAADAEQAQIEAARRFDGPFVAQAGALEIRGGRVGRVRLRERQIDVAGEVAGQLGRGEGRIIGVMVESNLVEGRQDLEPGKKLRFGQSVTDPCLGWEASVALLQSLAEGVKARRKA